MTPEAVLLTKTCSPVVIPSPTCATCVTSGWKRTGTCKLVDLALVLGRRAEHMPEPSTHSPKVCSTAKAEHHNGCWSYEGCQKSPPHFVTPLFSTTLFATSSLGDLRHYSGPQPLWRAAGELDFRNLKIRPMFAQFQPVKALVNGQSDLHVTGVAEQR